MSMFSLALEVPKWYMEGNINKFLELVDIDTFSERWGIDLCEPENIVHLSSYEEHNYSEYYEVYSYRDDQHLLKQLTQLDMDSEKSVNQSILSFISQATPEVRNIFDKHPLVAKVQDYYVYKEKRMGEEITILIYKQAEKKLYVLEKLGFFNW
ncbi:hypothetical protein FZW96_14190 [Bacillus sp. BGMRC 2118]|nr:hypothetical protein FZW96_14190 [Bacillus sp. BGMRC 2118]